MSLINISQVEPHSGLFYEGLWIAGNAYLPRAVGRSMSEVMAQVKTWPDVTEIWVNGVTVWKNGERIRSI
jgi:hypothetical protein